MGNHGEVQMLTIPKMEMPNVAMFGSPPADHGGASQDALEMACATPA